MIDIETSRKICQAATEGPWELYGQHGYFDAGPVHMDARDHLNAGNDCAFVSHARTALPEALDEIEALRSKLANAELRINMLRETLKAIGGQ